MSSIPFTYDRGVPIFPAANCHKVADLVAIAAEVALQHSESLPATGRRFMSEAKRRDYSIRRARMFQWWDEFFEWLSYAPREVATLAAEGMRGIVVGHQSAVVPCLVTAIYHENNVGNRSDDYERWFLLEKTATRIDGVIHGWNAQVEATRLGLDIAHATRARQTYSLPS